MTRIVMNIPQMTDAARFMRAVSVEYENLGQQLQSGTLVGGIPSNVRYWVDSACRGVGTRLRALSTELIAEARQMDWRTGIVTHNPVIGMSRMLSMPGTRSSVGAGATSWFSTGMSSGRDVLVIGGRPSTPTRSSGMYLDPAAVAAANRSSRVLTIGAGTAYRGSPVVLDPAAVAAANRSSTVLTIGAGTAYVSSPLVLNPGSLAAANRSSGILALPSGSGSSGSHFTLDPGAAARPQIVLNTEGATTPEQRRQAKLEYLTRVQAGMDRDRAMFDALSPAAQDAYLGRLGSPGALAPLMAQIESENDHRNLMESLGYEYSDGYYQTHSEVLDDIYERRG